MHICSGTNKVLIGEEPVEDLFCSRLWSMLAELGVRD